MKLSSDRHLGDAWSQEAVERLHSEIVTDFLKCETEHGVRASVNFVKYLCHKGLDSQNYPFYMSLFLHPNQKVIHAFLSDGKILNALVRLQRNHQLIQLCLELLERFSPPRVYPKILLSLLTIIHLNYRSPESGFQVYALGVDDLYHIGKYLDKQKPQSHQTNRLILDILADLSDLKAKEVAESVRMDLAARANKIRNVFFDNRASMADIIPHTMLV